MKILYLALVELEVHGAPRTHTIEICENLVKLGHEVILLAPKPSRKIDMLNCPVVFIPFWGFSIPALFVFFLVSGFYLFWYTLRFNPDCIYEREMGLNILPAFVSKLTGRSFVIEVNGFILDDLKLINASKIRIFFTKLAQYWELKWATAVIVSTEGVRQKIITNYKLAPSKVLFLSPGVNTDLFYPMKKSECQDQVGLSNDDIYIGFVGSFHPHHDIFTIIESMTTVIRKIPNLKLILVGDGYNFQKCKDLVQKLEISQNVIFTGQVSYQKIPLYINSFDISVLPLTKAKINQQNGVISVKLGEYLACGQAIITTDLPGSSTFDRLQNVVVAVPPENPQKMAEKILFLLQNQKLCKEIGQRSQIFVEKQFTWSKVAKNTIEFLNSRLKGIN